MVYISRVVENLAVLCNPIWVVNANRKWMEHTQHLIVIHQRLEILKTQIYPSTYDESFSLGRNNACCTLKDVKQSSDFDRKNEVSQEEWGEKLNDIVKPLSLVKIKADDELITSSSWGPGYIISQAAFTSNTSSRVSSTSSSPRLEASSPDKNAATKNYGPFDCSSWMDFSKFSSFMIPAAWDLSTLSQCRPEPCRGDPAAWASWMLQHVPHTCNEQEPSHRLQKTFRADIAGALLLPASERELEGITELVLNGIAGAGGLLKAVRSAEVRRLWDAPDRGCADPQRHEGAERHESHDNGANTAAGADSGRESVEREVAPVISAVSQAREAPWEAIRAVRLDRGREWPLAGSAAERELPQPRPGGAERRSCSDGLLFAPALARSCLAPPASAREPGYTSSSYALAVPHVRPAALHVVAQRAESAPLTALSDAGAARPADPGRSLAVQGASWPAASEQQTTWLPAGWPVSQQRTTATSQFSHHSAVMMPHSLQQRSATVSQILPLKNAGFSQYFPLHSSSAPLYTQSKSLGPSQYPQQSLSFPPYASLNGSTQPHVPGSVALSHSAFCRDLSYRVAQSQPWPRAAYPRVTMRHSSSDTSLRPGVLSAPGAAADRDRTPTGSPRGRPSTFEDFLHLLGVSDTNTTDLVELWRIGQVSGSSGPPSTELSPRSDALTPNAAASTPRERPAVPPPQLRRTKSLGSLPTAGGARQSVTSSSSRDSVTRRFDELEFLAVEQYESSDSLSRRFSDLERQALEQYALLSQQASREALPPSTVVPTVPSAAHRAAPGPPPPPPPPTPLPLQLLSNQQRHQQEQQRAQLQQQHQQHNPPQMDRQRGGSGRSGAGGRPRKRRGKKKSRELAVSTAVSSNTAWRAAARPPANAAGARRWAADDKAARSWARMASPDAVSGAGPTSAPSAGYPSLPSLAPPADGSHAFPQGMRLAPPAFAEPTRPSLPAGLIHVGQLAQAARLPAPQLLWPAAFSAGARRESGPGLRQDSSGGLRQDPVNHEDPTASCTLQ